MHVTEPRLVLAQLVQELGRVAVVGVDAQVVGEAQQVCGAAVVGEQLQRGGVAADGRDEFGERLVCVGVPGVGGERVAEVRRACGSSPLISHRVSPGRPGPLRQARID